MANSTPAVFNPFFFACEAVQVREEGKDRDTWFLSIPSIKTGTGANRQPLQIRASLVAGVTRVLEEFGFELSELSDEMPEAMSARVVAMVEKRFEKQHKGLLSAVEKAGIRAVQDELGNDLDINTDEWTVQPTVNSKLAFFLSLANEVKELTGEATEANPLFSALANIAKVVMTGHSDSLSKEEIEKRAIALITGDLASGQSRIAKAIAKIEQRPMTVVGEGDAAVSTWTTSGKRAKKGSVGFEM